MRLVQGPDIVSVHAKHRKDAAFPVTPHAVTDMQWFGNVWEGILRISAESPTP